MFWAFFPSQQQTVLGLGCSSFLAPSLPSLLPGSHSGQHNLLLLQLLPLYRTPGTKLGHGCDLRVVAVLCSVSSLGQLSPPSQPFLGTLLHQPLPREGTKTTP